MLCAKRLHVYPYRRRAQRTQPRMQLRELVLDVIQNPLQTN